MRRRNHSKLVLGKLIGLSKALLEALNINLDLKLLAGEKICLIKNLFKFFTDTFSLFPITDGFRPRVTDFARLKVKTNCVPNFMIIITK